MKVDIGNYKNFFGPYHLAELIAFWVKPVPDEYGILAKPDWVHDFGEWLAHGSVKPDAEPGEIYRLCDERPVTWIYRFLLWLDEHKKRRIKIRIDRWDSWSADHTLALVIVPVLKQLQLDKQGSPYVKDEDVPDHLKSTSAPPRENDYDVDDNHHLRWTYVLDEMIWAFEQTLNDDRESQFMKGNSDLHFKKLENGMSELVDGPSCNFEIDREAQQAYEDRIQNGLNLFAKYYSGLWS